VLMRLATVRHGVAKELLEQAWRRAAPSRVVAAYSSRAVIPDARGAVQSGARSARVRSEAPGARRRRPTRG
jgi:hypothetical protein